MRGFSFLGRVQAKKDAVVMVLLFISLSSLYLATASGITSSNGGSHYALLRTMLDNRTFALENFDDYAEGNDIALTEDGRLFSDRPPGNALTAIPFYLLGKILPHPLAQLPSRHDADNTALWYVLLMPVLAGAGTVTLLYYFLRQQHILPAAALITCLILGVGTAHWKYSTVFFSHALSSFIILLVVISAVSLSTPLSSSLPRFFRLGLLLGFSVLVEYSNGLLVGIICLFIGGQLSRQRPFSARKLFSVMAAIGLGGMPSILFLAFYNQVNFGDPFTLSYAYAVNYPWAGEFGSTFSVPLRAGLQALLIWGESGGWCGGPCMNQGLFLLSPVLLLAWPGYWLYGRRGSRPIFWLTTAVFLAYLLLFAKHHTAHGFTADGRYLVPFLSLLMMPIAYSLDWLWRRPETAVWQMTVTSLIFGLFFLSAHNMLLHIGFSYNYNLDLNNISHMVANPANWRYLSDTIFRNWRNLPLLWLLEGAGIAIMFIWLSRPPSAKEKK